MYLNFIVHLSQGTVEVRLGPNQSGVERWWLAGLAAQLQHVAQSAQGLSAL